MKALRLFHTYMKELLHTSSWNIESSYHRYSGFDSSSITLGAWT